MPKEPNARSENRKHRKYVLLAAEILIGLISGLLNGLFGAGGGSVVVPAMEHFLKMNQKKAHATAIAVILPMSAVSAAVYLRSGHFGLNLWIPVAAGGIAGGLAGAKLLAKMPKRPLSILFGIIIIISALKMIGIGHG